MSNAHARSDPPYSTGRYGNIARTNHTRAAVKPLIYLDDRDSFAEDYFTQQRGCIELFFNAHVAVIV